MCVQVKRSGRDGGVSECFGDRGHVASGLQSGSRHSVAVIVRRRSRKDFFHSAFHPLPCTLSRNMPVPSREQIPGVMSQLAFDVFTDSSRDFHVANFITFTSQLDL